MIGWKSILPELMIGTIAINIQIGQVVAQTLSQKDIAKSASKFVVRIDGGGGGTGFITSRKNDGRYTVLTNKHVVESSIPYLVTTNDNRHYIAQNIRLLPNVDLAEIEFVSGRDYTIAPLSSAYIQGSTVYVYGWNATSQSLTERSSQIFPGSLAGSLSTGRNGYRLTISGFSAVPGMSGSPILNEEGKVIGIYGESDVQEQRDVKFLTFSLGIPIATYQRYSNIVRPISNNTIATKTRTPAMDVVRLLVKLSERRVYVYRGDRIITQYPVAVGKKGWETPVGFWEVIEKIVNPGQTNFKTGEVYKPDDPRNQLRERWIGFWIDGKDVIGFHGTLNPSSVGRATSQGTLRMYDRDVKELFNLVKVGTVVQVID
jgi:lipoprotein-anchoring transpeptidase ErfK/SrfK